VTAAEATPQLEGAVAAQQQPQPRAQQSQPQQPQPQQPQPQQPSQWQQPSSPQGNQPGPDGPAGPQSWAGQPQVPVEQQIHYGEDGSAWFYDPRLGSYSPATYQPDPATEQWYAQQAPYRGPEHESQPSPGRPASPEDTGTFPVPVGQPGGRTRQLGEGSQPEAEAAPEPRQAPAPEITIPGQRQEQQPVSRATAEFEDEKEREEAYYQVFRRAIDGSLPTARQFGEILEAEYGHTLTTAELKEYAERFGGRYDVELAQDHIA
jgi:hypothetical protein